MCGIQSHLKGDLFVVGRLKKGSCYDAKGQLADRGCSFVSRDSRSDQDRRRERVRGQQMRQCENEDCRTILPGESRYLGDLGYQTGRRGSGR